MTRRVVVTGIGMITALGHNACDNWEAMAAGRSGIASITLFDPSGYESRVAGEVKDFDPSKYMDRKEARRADRVTQLAFVAANEALAQSGYDPASSSGEDFAVIIGTAIGGIATLIAEYDTLREKGHHGSAPSSCR